MKYRMANLMATKEYTTDDVKTIDIDLTDPISEIEIMARPLNDTDNSAPGVHPAAVLEKIEIVDGSDVLYNLNGYQAQAVDFYNRNSLRQPWLMYLNNNYMDLQVGINFGRELWDDKLAFDPTQFSNPQLKITIDVDGGGAKFDAVKLAVNAAIFDEKTITPEGFLLYKHLKSYTMGSATHEYITMPTDYPYRKMFVQALTPGSEPGTEVDTIKISENHDKKIPFNAVTFEEITRLMSYTHPPIVEGIIQWCGTTATYGYCTPTTRVMGAVNSWKAAADLDPMSFYDGDGGRYALITTTSVKNVNVVLQGNIPHGVYEIPFGNPQITEDWYDVASIKNLEVDILSKTGGSTDVCEIFLEQLRPY